jgi:YjbE family integral membrane protein
VGTGLSSLASFEFWARWIGIVIIDLTLAGDNAVVIALAVRKLPKHQHLWGRIWGTGGAVVLRLAGIAVVSYFLKIPLLQCFGALALLWIAVKLVKQEEAGEDQVRPATTLWEAVWIIIVADVIMSLDNVLAVAAAARGDMVLVVFGIALSLPLVVYGSGILARLMTRFEWIVWVGGGVLGFVSGEMIVKDPIVHRWLGETAHLLERFVPGSLALLLTALGWWFEHRQKSRRPAC